MTASPGHSWGQKINVIVPKSVQLCVLPRAARDMEMGWMELQEQLCQPSGQPQRGCDWCDAGVTQGMWHTWGPPLPQAPLAPAWAAGGGLAIKMLLVFKQLESPCVCSLGGRLLTPPPALPGLEGGSQPGQCRESLSALVTQLLTKQLFLLTQKAQPPSCPAEPPCPGWHPPPGAKSQLRGPRAGGDTPTPPQNPITPQGWGFPVVLWKLEAPCPAHQGLGCPGSTWGFCC